MPFSTTCRLLHNFLRGAHSSPPTWFRILNSRVIQQILGLHLCQSSNRQVAVSRKLVLHSSRYHHLNLHPVPNSSSLLNNCSGHQIEMCPSLEIMVQLLIASFQWCTGHCMHRPLPILLFQMLVRLHQQSFQEVCKLSHYLPLITTWLLYWGNNLSRGINKSNRVLGSSSLNPSNLPLFLHSYSSSIIVLELHCNWVQKALSHRQLNPFPWAWLLWIEVQ